MRPVLTKGVTAATIFTVEFSDGSCAAGLQVIVDAAVHPLACLTATGVEGEIKYPPKGTKQNVDLKVSRVLEVGEVDAAAYPLLKGKVKTQDATRDAQGRHPPPFAHQHVIQLQSLLETLAFQCECMGAWP